MSNLGNQVPVKNPLLTELSFQIHGRFSMVLPFRESLIHSTLIYVEGHSGNILFWPPYIIKSTIFIREQLKFPCSHSNSFSLHTCSLANTMVFLSGEYGSSVRWLMLCVSSTVFQTWNLNKRYFYRKKYNMWNYIVYTHINAYMWMCRCGCMHEYIFIHNLESY